MSICNGNYTEMLTLRHLIVIILVYRGRNSEEEDADEEQND